MENRESISFTLTILGKDTTLEELDKLTRQLYQELSHIDLDELRLLSTQKEIQGTKGLDPVVIGALVVATLPPVLTKVLELIQAWAMRQQDQVLKIKIESGALEVEVPVSMKPSEVKMWISTIQNSLTQTKKPLRKRES